MTTKPRMRTGRRTNSQPAPVETWHQVWAFIQMQLQTWMHRKASKIFTRRVAVIVICALVIQLLAEHFSIHLFGKMGELFTASVVEHIFFNVPLLDE